MNMDINVTNKLLAWISYVYVLNYTIAGFFLYITLKTSIQN